MKKIFCFIIASLFFFEASYSQSKANDKNFRFGLKAVPAFAWLKPDNKAFEAKPPKFSFAYGLMTDFNFTSNYAFSTGVEINNNGGVLGFPTAPDVDSTYYIPDKDTNKFYLKTRTYRLRYITLPILLKLRTNEIGAMTYYGQFGVDAGFKIKAFGDDEGTVQGTNTITKNESVDIQKDINFLRLALNIGLGFELNLAGTTSLVVGVNYNNGFTNVLKKDSKNLKDVKGVALQQNAISNFVSLTVGILF
ncbi:MAG: porin family protein [Bacteroidales bacterium]|nr:porin family protein [Bacteroidales bacterium]